MTKRPRFFRSVDKHIFGWEIHDWRHWFITISIGHFEVQLNWWRVDDDGSADA